MVSRITFFNIMISPFCGNLKSANFLGRNNGEKNRKTLNNNTNNYNNNKYYYYYY